ncbi:MAG TPA: zinc ribbon domain-containing protein [Thermoplasmata archaeon]|nr:zinc ribbon domain-containing protein [Thermoplasmata archaeon]
MGEYRVLTNEVLREALLTSKSSRGALSRFARDRAFVHHLTGQHAVVAANLALTLAKAHRRRLRRGGSARIPYVRRRFVRTDPKTFHFDPDSGKIRLSLRNGEWCSWSVRVARYHRTVLAAPGVRIKQLHVNEERVVLYLEREAPDPYSPTSLLALDTNESSLDGVFVGAGRARWVRAFFPEVRTIQARHFARRRFLARKKAHDRRVARLLLSNEGRRERHRIRSRLDVLSKRLVESAARRQAAIALEDLSKLPLTKRRASSRFRRRLSSWPRSELHRQIEYKAAERGVPVYWVNPFRTSISCPRCGEITRPRSRVGTMFDCAHCGWSKDRQLNAGANVARTVLRETAELGGLRLDPDALSNDAVRPLFPREKSSGNGRSGRRGRDRLEGGTPSVRLSISPKAPTGNAESRGRGAVAISVRR